MELCTVLQKSQQGAVQRAQARLPCTRALQQTILGSAQLCSRCREVLRMHACTLTFVCIYLTLSALLIRSLMPPPVLQWLHVVSCCTTVYWFIVVSAYIQKRALHAKTELGHQALSMHGWNNG